jgi:hypothetical protein
MPSDAQTAKITLGLQQQIMQLGMADRVVAKL